jgi:membrane peptidoglycan carboxypeptidase
VIDAMVAQGDISPAVGAEAKAAPLLPEDAKHRKTLGPTRVPFFVQYVTELLKNRYGEDVTFNGGLRVYTTIDLNEQAHAEKTIRDHLGGIRQGGAPLSGALVSIDPRDGEVKAMVGGAGHFNVAANGHRQPGSAFKPFVLAAALRKGIQPDTVIESRKVILQQDETHFILVRNDFPKYSGEINLRRAMTESDNTVYAQLTQTVQPAAVVDAAHDLGIVSPLDPNLAIGLGGLRIGVTPLEMAHAYATLAARGRRVGGSILFHTPDAGYESPTQDPISILRVDHPGGQKDVNRPASTPVLEETDALSVIDSMRGVVNLEIGTGNAAALEGRAVIGKTGTTSDFKDAWFVGFTPQRATAVWVGYIKPARSMARDYKGKPVFGGTYPAEIWHDFSRVALRDEDRADFPFSPGRRQDLFNVDVRRDPYVRAPFGCAGVRQLVMAVEARPADETTQCKRGLTFVPDLHGLTRGRASDLADGQGLAFQYEFVAAEPGQRVDLVVDQIPDPGIQVPIGDPVRVFIAREVPLVRLPDVTGLSVREAVARLQAVRFRVIIEDGATDLDAADGVVVGQDAQADQPAPRGATITIAVTGDIETAEIPDVSTLTVAEARRILQRLGLVARAERASGNGVARDDDVVISTDVPPGSQVFPRSEITIRSGRPSAPPPEN